MTAGGEGPSELKALGHGVARYFGGITPLSS